MEEIKDINHECSPSCKVICNLTSEQVIDDKLNAPGEIRQQLGKYEKCDCRWQDIVLSCTNEYSYEYCGHCNKIKKFHWRSFWKRLKGIIN